MYRNSNFVFLLPMKILEKNPSKVGYFSKIAENFSTAKSTSSAQRVEKKTTVKSQAVDQSTIQS